MILITTNEATTLAMVAADGRTDLYGRAVVYDSLGGVTATVDLTHVAGGLYQASYTPTVSGYYQVVYRMYFDALRTQDAGYEVQGETLDVSNFRTNIIRLLGLVHENALIDQTVYDGDGNLTSARVRLYDSAANAASASAASPAAYNTGKIAEWQVTATFSAGFMSKHWITRVV